MTPQPPDIQRIILVAQRLGPLKDSVVFVGGAVVPLLISDPAAAPPRPTEDVDVILGVTSRPEYYRLERELRQLGFKQTMREGDPICRWEIESVLVDVMPAEETVLGFSSRWYKSAIESAVVMRIGPIDIKVISAPCFIATKLEAFNNRGASDYLLSPDMEDILSVIDGRPELTDEIRAAESALKRYLTESVRNLLQDPAFLNSLPGHLRADSTSQARLPILLERLRRISLLE